MLVALKANAEALGQDPESFYPFTMYWGTVDWHHFLIPAFSEGEPDPERLVIPPQLWPEAKDGLRFLNKLYNEGLMFDDTLDKDQAIRKQIAIDGQTAIFTTLAHGPTFNGYGAVYEKMRQADPDARLVTLFPWGQNPGDHPVFFNSGKYGTAWITPSSTDHPEEVVQYFDYMATEEGYQTASLGINGEHWEPTAEGFRRLVDDDTVTRQISWIMPNFDVLTLPFFDAANNADVLYGSMAHADEYLVWSDEVERAGNYPIPIVNVPTPARNRYFGVIESEWRDALFRIVFSPESEFDELFDEAIAAYRANGGDEVEAESVANYREAYGN